MIQDNIKVVKNDILNLDRDFTSGTHRDCGCVLNGMQNIFVEVEVVVRSFDESKGALCVCFSIMLLFLMCDF